VIGQHVMAGLLPWLGAAAGVIAIGAWLKWATAPVAFAFRLGVATGRAVRRTGRAP
jgi:hypothetical protein